MEMGIQHGNRKFCTTRREGRRYNGIQSVRFLNFEELILFNLLYIKSERAVLSLRVVLCLRYFGRSILVYFGPGKDVSYHVLETA